MSNSFVTSLDCIPPGFSVHDISQAEILEWVAISFSRGSSWPRDLTCSSCIGKWVLYPWATWEILMDSYLFKINCSIKIFIKYNMFSLCMMKFIHYQPNILTEMYNHHHTTIFKLCHHLKNFLCAPLKIGGVLHSFAKFIRNLVGYFLFIVKLNLLPFIRVLQLFKIKIILWFSFCFVTVRFGHRLALLYFFFFFKLWIKFCWSFLKIEASLVWFLSVATENYVYYLI